MKRYVSCTSGRGSAWLERLVRDQEAGGSNPLAPTISSPRVNRFCANHFREASDNPPNPGHEMLTTRTCLGRSSTVSTTFKFFNNFGNLLFRSRRPTLVQHDRFCHGRGRRRGRLSGALDLNCV